MLGIQKRILEAATEANVTFIYAKYGVDRNVSTLYSVRKIGFLPLILDKIERERL